MGVWYGLAYQLSRKVVFSVLYVDAARVRAAAMLRERRERHQTTKMR